MEDQSQTQTQTSPSSPSIERHEPVRSRWTPKPEQILILESIFNSGMVNPPKEETVKIRKLLEKFGSVGDANVFYWFQNRRSRSRRRQRQIQASLISSGSLEQHHHYQQQQEQQSQIVVQQDSVYTTTTQGFVMQQPSFFPTLQSLSPFDSSSSSSSSRLGGADEIYSIDNNNSMPSSFLHLDTSKVQYEVASGVITVFINGVPAEVESGQLNMKAMCGEDLTLVHSSGVPVPLDEYGVSVSGLQHGESYFLVPRSI